MWRMADLIEGELAMAQSRAMEKANENIEMRYQRGAFKKHMAKLRFACKDVPPTKEETAA